ncbi:MAG: acyl-phosphate glycerol 3-phosphate acyltransferase [Omnitrophica WOR_2 bacterium GWF2_38_59]|nr:MAG: acyl-phosphate glycerol 3-phosphate acyltransferase [Omnitrophica WOR_2 bacterium GWA2_37_7]OGX22211.1 MAG: acyl-phosphate glycerol 3-phosphate acyltransferase [Omnitrophica WOR_2 bacterium GWF2_38_59]OGX46816.1 MAG: acyl-phosphate glycerol 3-phosphate acyltransferase [Omnitrophica WOR_2 bacterium RIFOXYA2_FULL_38_17]OGX51616.1 MAG: acyl-phosphate glycerol 3-phosphate acyltransferase [Omnitrophica WOR_2 bacterium RIFOXYA12_FULL_38_10]OGX58788.1 MAG: acyl-phosphate glycerol 3-phosphate a
MIILGIIISYFIGSIPTAYIYGKLYKGIDIREHGSGNAGATNVFRVLGKIPGIIVLVIDILKGVLPVVIVADVLGSTQVIERILFAVCAVCGHNWTIFLNFKGGKGIATSLGVLIGLTIKIASIRIVLILTVLSWLVSFAITGIVSLSSIIAGTFLPVIMVFSGQSFEIICLGVVFCIFVTLRHRPNIKRLLAGKEPKVKLPFHKK